MIDEDLLFHVAPSAARLAILECGILPAAPGRRWAKYQLDDELQPAGVYLWSEARRAVEWSHDLRRLVRDDAIGLNDVWAVRLQVWRMDVTAFEDPVLGRQGALVLTRRVRVDELEWVLIDTDQARFPLSMDDVPDRLGVVPGASRAYRFVSHR